MKLLPEIHISYCLTCAESRAIFNPADGRRIYCAVDLEPDKHGHCPNHERDAGIDG
jgi:hypothetical protein